MYIALFRLLKMSSRFDGSYFQPSKIKTQLIWLLILKLCKLLPCTQGRSCMCRHRWHQAEQETRLSDSSRSTDQGMACALFQGLLSLLLKYLSSKRICSSKLNIATDTILQNRINQSTVSEEKSVVFNQKKGFFKIRFTDKVQGIPCNPFKKGSKNTFT